MTRHGSWNTTTTHPGISEEPAAPKCCTRCRRGTPATGLGVCGYNLKCKCHGPDAAFKVMLERSSLGTPEAATARSSVTDEHAQRIVALAHAQDALARETARFIGRDPQWFGGTNEQ